MLRAALAKGGIEVVAVNDPFLDVDYMVQYAFMYTCIYHAKKGKVLLVSVCGHLNTIHSLILGG